ncbi:MAG: DNA cytosine methyltransferase [Pseudomonadota bacterium]
MSERLAFLEFFAGGGMARLGLTPDFNCVFANDNDPTKSNIYRRNFGHNHFLEGDVNQLNVGDIPAADLAWASSPCQDLSLAGNRSGLNSTRSGAFWGFWRLMRDLGRHGRAPLSIVIENVPGLLTSSQGRDFETLIAAMREIGYSCRLFRLDAVHFVPQSRPRIFIVAVRISEDFRLRALELPQPPIRQSVLGDILELDLPSSAWRTEVERDKLLSQMSPKHRARVHEAQNEVSLSVGAVYRRVRNGIPRAEVRYDGVAGCIRTLKGGSSRQLILVSECGNLRLRGLTATEVARLMGLPADYRLPNSMTAATNLAGDGVCVPLVRWFAEHILTPLTMDIKAAHTAGSISNSAA